jgi:hypothetical protein
MVESASTSRTTTEQGASRYVGSLIYGGTGLHIQFEDRVLAHLQIVMTAKLRRNEGFQFSWRDSDDLGAGRRSIWLHASIPLYFTFDSAEQPAINRTWLDVLSMTSNSASGLRIVEEPKDDPPRQRALP